MIARSHLDLFLEIGSRLDRKGWVAANDGNLSVRLPDGTLLITAAGSKNGYLSREEIVRIDLDGRLLEGNYPPSSEFGLHTTIYRLRSDLGAVLHAHPPYATAFAAAGLALGECVLPEVVLTLGRVPLARYATPGTPELGRSVEKAILGHDAVLLENHGAVAGAEDLESAYFTMERVEHAARILLYARQLGGPNALTTAETRRLLATDPARSPSPEGALPCTPSEVSRAELRRVIREVLADRIPSEGESDG